MTRPSRRGTALLGVLVAAVLSTAGCTTTLEGAPAADPAPPPTEGPGSDPVAWADQVCAAVLRFAVPATSAPDYSASSDLSAVQRAFSDYLNNLAAGLEAGRAQLAAVGRAPDPVGDEAVSRAESTMQALARDVREAQAAVDAADVSDPAGFMTTLARAESTLAGMTPPNPLGGLSAAPRLQRAAEEAKRCQELSALPSAPR